MMAGRPSGRARKGFSWEGAWGGTTAGDAALPRALHAEGARRVGSGVDRTGETATPSGSATDAAGTSLGAQSDLQLLEGLRAGSELHFNELYNRYFQRIYSFVYTRMRNHADAEEVVQETFTAVYRFFESYRGTSSLLSWIYGFIGNWGWSIIGASSSSSLRLIFSAFSPSKASAPSKE